MKDEKSDPKKRVRRSREIIENNLLIAAKEIIEEVGFTNITVTSITQRAQIEAAVFYNRYKSIDDLCDKFVRMYDYWLNDSVNFDPDSFTPIQNCENLLLELVDSINASLVMQKLLVWELSENNDITRRTADNRERYSKKMLDYFNETLGDQGIDFNAFAAIIISGVYYLTLHKNISTFCRIDLNTKEGMNLIKETISTIVKKVYADKSPVKKDEAQIIQVAENLFKDNVELQVIKRATGLSEEILQTIKNKVQ